MLLLSLAAACGDDAEPPTTPPPTTTVGAESPAAAVSEWFAAVGSGRAADASELVVGNQVELLIAIENGLDTAALAGLLAGGIPAATQQQYWTSFAASFEDAAGDDIGNLRPGPVEEYAIDGRRFADVGVALAPGAGSTGLVTTEVGGRWRVDLLATLAPALSSQLRTLAVGLPADPEGEAVREVLVGQIPSLRAASERPAPGADLAVLRELEALVRFLAPAVEE